MGRRRLTAVTDAGPLIHLTEIGCLHILSIFEVLHVPEAVWTETVECGRTSSEDFLKFSKVERHNLLQSEINWFVEKNNLKDLHSGECECLFPCEQIDVPVLLTDDLAVRGAAKRLKLVPVGSLGIVAKACRLGKISMADAQDRILELYEVSSLFVTKAIVELAIEQLRNPASS